ncbi:MAG TPA: prepilin-type N-terminal cleavage/methylation domain-containing protein [Polyangiaceae bacterium]|nr:prepilin-type N-terminal cleavage/methylation domain-containing protein [Polyangiaceae bacterium]
MSAFLLLRSLRARRTGTSAGSRGYTAVEVLLAMTVLVIGAAGVMSMQKTSIQADLDARKMDVANAIARAWIERLERDAMKWTLPSTASPGAPSNIANAQLVSANVDQGWFIPNTYMNVTNPETMSYGFDILGRDLASGDLGSAVFCVSAQVVTLVPGQLYRGDVRVLWLRGLTPPTIGGSNSSSSAAAGFCSTNNGDLKAADPNAAGLKYRAIYATTSIRENAAQ